MIEFPFVLVDCLVSLLFGFFLLCFVPPMLNYHVDVEVDKQDKSSTSLFFVFFFLVCKIKTLKSRVFASFIFL